MVRMFVRYPTLQDVEIECEVEECARLLKLLGGSSPEPVAQAFSRKTVTNTTRASSDMSIGKRQYRGRNRRQMVLNTFRQLRSAGRIMPSLDDIREKYAELYPEENTTNLDQVVRDLANKTDLVERCERGTFRLSDPAV